MVNPVDFFLSLEPLDTLCREAMRRDCRYIVLCEVYYGYNLPILFSCLEKQVRSSLALKKVIFLFRHCVEMRSIIVA